MSRPAASFGQDGSLESGGAAEPDSTNVDVRAEGAPNIHPWASVESVRQRVGRYREIGITELVFYYPETEADARVMERVAADVLPELGAAK